jgi:REP element-mobilizing transposase RayT
MTELPIRKNPRLKAYNYAQAGCYFLTICVKDRHERLGTVVGAASCRPHVELSDYGRIVKTGMERLSHKYPYIDIDNYTITPNHLHMILSVQKPFDFDEHGRQNAAPTETVGRMMGYFKYQTTKAINIPGFWQRSYHDHIIRDKAEYQLIWQYIEENPARWREDRYFTKDNRYST